MAAAQVAAAILEDPSPITISPALIVSEFDCTKWLYEISARVAFKQNTGSI